MQPCLVTVTPASEGQRLDNYLLKTLKGVPKSHIYRIIRSGEVRVNKGRAKADQKLQLGDAVRLPPLRMPQAPSPLSSPVDITPPVSYGGPSLEGTLLHEDADFIAIDKPAGLAVHGGSGVSQGVIEQLRAARPQAPFLELVHRLDRETSGILLIAKRRAALLNLQAQFKARETGKTYLALVLGAYPTNQKVIDLPLHKFVDSRGERRVEVVSKSNPKGQRSITLVKVRAPLHQACGDFTLLEVTIKTGRTHQIRVHLASTGFPIAGDERYGDFEQNKRLCRRDALGLKRMFLHASLLSFVHPSTQVPMVIECPLPPELERVLRA